MSAQSRQTLLRALEQECADFHGFLNEWFPGTCPRDDALFEARHAAHLDDAFEIILPDGGLMARGPFITYLHGLYGANPAFRKEIRGLEIRASDASGLVLVNYQEWQKNASNTTPANHARMVSAALRPSERTPSGLQWLQIHETMLAAEAVADDPFDF